MELSAAVRPRGACAGPRPSPPGRRWQVLTATRRPLSQAARTCSLKKGVESRARVHASRVVQQWAPHGDRACSPGCAEQACEEVGCLAAPRAFMVWSQDEHRDSGSRLHLQPCLLTHSSQSSLQRSSPVSVYPQCWKCVVFLFFSHLAWRL